ncbi:MAG: hypothetical protein RLZ12_704 [Bacillota bacterium]
MPCEWSPVRTVRIVDFLADTTPPLQFILDLNNFCPKLAQEIINLLQTTTIEVDVSVDPACIQICIESFERSTTNANEVRVTWQANIPFTVSIYEVLASGVKELLCEFETSGWRAINRVTDNNDIIYTTLWMPSPLGQENIWAYACTPDSACGASYCFPPATNGAISPCTGEVIIFMSFVYLVEVYQQAPFELYGRPAQPRPPILPCPGTLDSKLEECEAFSELQQATEVKRSPFFTDQGQLQDELEAEECESIDDEG